MKKINIYICACLLILSSCQEPDQFIGFTYPDGNHKALVLSYDDGSIEDIRLAKLFDQNNLVGTFNLNSAYIGELRAWPMENGDTIFQQYIWEDSLLSVYRNHEIAAHGAFHKNFTDITHDEVLEEVNSDIDKLTALTGRKIISMAYPFGSTNEDIAKLIATTGIINARTVNDTYAFDLPENFLIWDPTCHDSKVLDFLDAYLELKDTDLSLFYVWGHSWEFGDQQRWDNMVLFCKNIGKAKDIWFVGNGELAEYLNAIEKVEIHEKGILNPESNEPVWIKLSSGIHRLDAGEMIEIKIRETNKSNG